MHYYFMFQFFFLKIIFFVRRTSKVSLVSVVLSAEKGFSRTSVVQFQVCGKLQPAYNFTALVRKNQLSACKTTPKRLTLGMQRTKNIVRITCGTYLIV